MGNFLVIVPLPTAAANATLFRTAVQRFKRLKGRAPSAQHETAWAQVAAFTRENGTGGKLAQDATTGSWLLAVGSWFHADGSAAGAEAHLLARALTVGADRLAQELEGFFVIAVGDGRSRRISVITDVVGSRHCFWRQTEQGIALATSSLVLASLGAPEFDPLSGEEFLRTGVVFEDRTLFRAVRKLPAAQVLQFSDGQSVSAHQYWSLSQLDPEKFDQRSAAPALREALLGSAQKIGRLFARPVCDLTGGYDSRAVVAAFLAAKQDFATTVAGPAQSADVQVAAELSRLTGKPHLYREPGPEFCLPDLRRTLALTDGECDLVAYARIRALHQTLAEQFSVSINGSFGELARGYWWELLGAQVGARQPLDARQLAAQRYVVEPCHPQLFPATSNDAFVAHLAAVIARANASLTDQPNSTQMDNAYLQLRMQRWQGRLASSTDQLWPCLSPFMFRSVLEVMLQTQARVRRRSLLVRQLMPLLHAGLAAHRLEHGHPPLPLNWRTWPRFLPAVPVFARKVARKLGLTTVGANPALVQMSFWQHPETRADIQALLDPAQMRLGDWFDPARLRAFLVEAHPPSFPFAAQWNRMLSLELTLRTVHEELSSDVGESA